MVTNNSVETILTYENTDPDQWSQQWSTTHIPGMDNATGWPRIRVRGRKRLRMGSLVLGALLAMHCRVSASALTGGLFVFMLFLVLAVAALANPLRHFEVYLGEWSISGPGRAFRVVPVLEGIGIAMCINAIIRAITCCSIAAIASLYVIHSVSDAKLPFTYCRDLDLQTYEPIIKDIDTITLQETRFSMETGRFVEDYNDNVFLTTVGLTADAWRAVALREPEKKRSKKIARNNKPLQIAICNETYNGRYPVLYSTPAYNFFYVEVVHLREDYSLGHFNTSLMLSNVFIWSVIWILILSERFRYGKLIWNNVHTWFVIIPWIWTAVLSLAAASSLITMNKSFKKMFRMGVKEVLAAAADALEVALYIHSAGVGTEIIHGKGLNHYASGHIDPHLGPENVLHSALLLIVCGLHSTGAALCAVVDSTQLNSRNTYNMAESTLWIIPMYSKCTSLGGHSHFMTTLIFGGLVFSYMTVAFILIKTALHIIFEYKVKLVFVEQFIVAALILTCMGLSLLFATNGGIALLESVDAIMSGVAIAIVCLLELLALLYVYRAHDFVSDMNISTEENSCSSNMDTQWQMIPFITLVTLFLKGTTLGQAELPTQSMYLALVPLIVVLLSVPIRGVWNVVAFMQTSPRRT